MLFHGVDIPAITTMAMAQGLTVSLAGPSAALARRNRDLGTPAPVVRPRWAVALLAPPAIFVAMVALLARHPDAARLVVELAAVGVPALAAVATKGLARHAWPAIVASLIAAAFVFSDELVGQVAILGLLVLSCVAIGALIPRLGLGHPLALAAGAATLALADIVLVATGPVDQATTALDSVSTGHLPFFGEAIVGTVHMGYGDLAIAGIAGAIAARTPGGASRVGLLTLILFLAEAALLAGPTAYPATLPVVLALAIDALWRLRAERSSPERYAPERPCAPAS